MEDGFESIHIRPVSPRLMMSSMALLAMAAGGDGFFPGGYRREEIPEKPCLNCGKPKRHNNSFCSAECCRIHRGR